MEVIKLAALISCLLYGSISDELKDEFVTYKGWAKGAFKEPDLATQLAEIV